MVGLCSGAHELFDRGRHRQQGRGRLAAPRRFACGGQIVEDVAMRLLKRGHHRPHRVHTLGTLRAGCPKAALAPEHAGPDGTCGRMVRGLHPGVAHARPQGPAPLEDLAATPRGLRHPACLTSFQQPLHLAPDGRIERAKLACVRGPSRTRCHQWNLWRACARNASPSSRERPPRLIMASLSRRRCAQQSCRRQLGYQV
jgi:hypothetical protein